MKKLMRVAKLPVAVTLVTEVFVGCCSSRTNLKDALSIFSVICFPQPEVLSRLL
jgi:hypothetical protein